MPDREEDKARLRRKASQEAISLAMQSRWQEAVTVNQNIIELFPPILMPTTAWAEPLWNWANLPRLKMLTVEV